MSRKNTIKGLAITISLAVLAVVLFYFYTLNADLLRRAAFKDLQIQKYYREGYFGKGITVAVVDSGVEESVDFSDRILAFKDFVNEKPEPYDDYGHGTNICKLISGNGKSSLGMYKGVAPLSNLVVCKVIDEDGNANLKVLESAIEWVIENKDKYNIKILCMSLGLNTSEGEDIDYFKKVIDQLADAGIIIVTSSGNNGYGFNTMTFPAKLSNVISVGSVDITRKKGKVSYKASDFSSEEMDLKPTAYAPGNNILIGASIKNALLDRKFVSGTSYSCAIICGKLCLILESETDLNLEKVKMILQENKLI